MNENAILKEYDRLIRYTVKRHTSYIDQSRTCNTFEDLLQEGRIAALKAVRSYSNKRKVKLSTYISNCVKNRLIDLNRAAQSKRVPPSDSYEDMTLFEKGTVGEGQETEAKISLERYMKTDDFKLVMQVIEDGSSIKDLIEDVKRKRLLNIKDRYERSHIERLVREDIVKCLSQAQQLLELKGKNQELKTSV